MNQAQKGDSEMKRYMIPMMILVLMALYIATGCAPAANPTAPAATTAPTQPPAAATSAPSGVTITVAAVKGVEDQGVKSVIPDWEKKTGNKVELIELPYSNLQD